jgi:cytochrome P450
MGQPEVSDQGSAENRKVTGTAGFNLFAPDVRRDPYPYYKMLRDFPVCRVAPLEALAVGRYDDVLFVLKNAQLFSSSVMRRADSTLLGADAPAHTRARPIVNRAFSLSATPGLEDRLRSEAQDIVSRIVSRKYFDLVSEFANRLPIIAIAEILGISEREHAELELWSQAVVTGSSGDPRLPQDPQTSKRIDEFNAFFERAILERQANPRDDYISRLLHAKPGEDMLTQQQALSICKLLLIAGNETTTNLIGNAVLALMQNPDELAKISADPALIPGLIEETMRYDSPVQILFRRATQDVEISGVEVKKDAQVMAILGSANRDERIFENPDLFDIGRDARDHIGFGYGPHSCLGASLARLEASIALEALHPWLARIRAAEPLSSLSHVDSINLRGVKSLRLEVVAN